MKDIRWSVIRHRKAVCKPAGGPRWHFAAGPTALRAVWQISRLGLLLPALISLPGWLKAESAEEVLHKAVTVESLPNYRAEFEMTSASQQKDAAKSVGVKYGTRRDGARLQRTEMTVRSAAGAEDKIVTIVANDRVVQLFPAQKRAVEMEGPVTTPLVSALAACFADARNFTSSLRAEEMGGRKTYVVSMAFAPAAIEKQKELLGQKESKFVIARQEKWIDAETSIIMQIVSYDAQGKIVTGTKYLKVEQNVPLSADLYDVPADYVVSRVKDVVGMIKETVKVSVANASKRVPPLATGTKQEAINPMDRRTMWTIVGVVSAVVAMVWSVLRNRMRKTDA